MEHDSTRDAVGEQVLLIPDGQDHDCFGNCALCAEFDRCVDRLCELLSRSQICTHQHVSLLDGNSVFEALVEGHGR